MTRPTGNPPGRPPIPAAEKRVAANITLSPEADARLRALAKAHRMPMSRVVDALLLYGTIGGASEIPVVTGARVTINPEQNSYCKERPLKFPKESSDE